MNPKLFTAAFAVLSLLSMTARASLVGATVTSQYYEFGGPYDDNGSPTTFVVTMEN